MLFDSECFSCKRAPYKAQEVVRVWRADEPVVKS
jgi:hypothetical protein